MRNRSSISTRSAAVLGPLVIVHLAAVIHWNLLRIHHDVWCNQGGIHDYCGLTLVSFYNEATPSEWWWSHVGAIAYIAVFSTILLTLFTIGTWIIRGRAPRMVTRIADWFDGTPAHIACTDKDCPCATHQNQTFVTKWQLRS